MENITPIVSEWDNWETSKPSSFIHQVMRGQSGKNIGLGNGLNKINEYIHGIQKGRYYLVGADSGVGKTTLTDFMFLLSAFFSAKHAGRRIKIFYFSFEIGTADKYARWASYFIFLATGERLPSDYILGRIEGRPLTERHLEAVKEAYRAIDEMMKHVLFTDRSLSPTQIYNVVIDYFSQHGTLKREEIKGVPGDVIEWTPSPEMAETDVFIIGDHIALCDEEPGETQKTNIDIMSKYTVKLRNAFNLTAVWIQQFSTDRLSAARQLLIKKTLTTLIPTRLDFGDSKTSYRDADVVLGLICPGHDLGELAGWSLDRHGGLGLYMVLICIMKNRYGIALKQCPIFLDGLSGVAEDLQPDADLPTRMVHYAKAREIDQTCQIFSPQKK